MMVERDNVNGRQNSRNSAFIKAGQTRLLYMQAPISNSVVFIIGVIFYFILRPVDKSTFLFTWEILLFSGAILRLTLWYMRKVKPKSRSPEGWMHLYVFACALLGLSWSLIYHLIYSINDPIYITAIIVLGIGVISSTVPILSVNLTAFSLYILPQGVTIFVALILTHEPTYYLFALAFLIYLIMTMLFARNSNRAIIESLSLEESNIALIESLNKEVDEREEKIEQRTQQLQEKNRSLSTAINKQVETTEKLKQLNVDLEATLIAIPDLMVEFDEHGTILDMWASDSKLLLDPKNSMIGKNVTTLFSEKAALEIKSALGKAKVEGKSHGQIVLIEQHNQQHWFELSTSLKLQAKGNYHFLMLFRDITEKKRMEDELFNMKKLESVGVLAGGIAHDFNNLLTSILGRIELAAKSIEGKDNVAALLLSEAKEATHRAAKLTQQFLTFSKGGDPVKDTTSLVELVKESSEFVLLGSRINCAYTFADDLWMVHADSGQVAQVIQNITLNAKEAMAFGGQIAFRCKNVKREDSKNIAGIKEGEYVSIAIKDCGAGIHPDIIDKIFDPYYTTKEDGNGLGLASCHAIIQKHLGKIVVDSLPGQGTTFTIYLPAVTQVLEDKSGVPQVHTRVKDKRILVMDDDETVRDIAEMQLLQLGHTPVTVSEGGQAIDTYLAAKEKGNPFDLVIMDLTIRGGMGGADTIKTLHSIDKSAKVVVASGYSNDPVMANYREYGFCSALAKPFDLNMLEACLRRVFLPAREFPHS